MYNKLEEFQKRLELYKEELALSNYGPKKAGLYNQADNERRKESRTGDVVEGIGPNTASRSYSTKPGQLSAKASAAQEQRKVKKLSGPVKIFTAEEKQALQEKMKKEENIMSEEKLDKGKGAYQGEISSTLLIDRQKKKPAMVTDRPYSGVAGSSKQQLAHQEKELKAKNAKQPVKTFSEEEKRALATKMGLKKEECSIDKNGQWTLKEK